MDRAICILKIRNRFIIINSIIITFLVWSLFLLASDSDKGLLA